MAKSSIGRALELLDELPPDAGRIRGGALEALTTAEVGDGAGLAGICDASDGRVHGLSWALSNGTASALYARASRPEGGRHAFRLTDLRLCRPVERRCFRSLEQLVGRDKILESPTWTELYRAARVWDQVRLVIARGADVLAHLTVVRGVGATLFGSSDMRRLQQLVQPLRRAIVTADALERRGTPDGPAELVLDARGRVQLASQGAQAWLDRPGFREHLTTLVRNADRERWPSSTHTVGQIDLVRIHGENGRVAYIAHVTTVQPLRLSPTAALTDAQREIAELVASGATLPEAARSTGRSLETVRSHLRAIYERLGVASRAELARALERATPT